MTLGDAAAARVRLILWWPASRSSSTPVEMALIQYKHPTPIDKRQLLD